MTTSVTVHRASVWSLALAASISACGGGLTGSRAPRPRPAAEPVIERPRVDPLATPWIVQHTGVPVTNTVEVTAIIESRVDTMSTVTTDSIRTAMRATWSVPSRGWPRRIVGSVSDFRVGARSDSASTPADVLLPIAFSAQQASRGVQPTFSTPATETCGGTSAIVVQGVRDLWVSLPDTLGPDMRWSDSTRYVVCRDSIPLTMDVRREFRVTGAAWRDSTIIATIERRSHVTVHGTGRQFGDSVTLSGDGEGHAALEVSLRGGAILAGSGESTLRLRLRGSRRIQELTQRSRIEIRDR